MSDFTLDIGAWIDLLPEPTLVMNVQGQIVAINPSGREFFGGNVLGRSLSELVVTPPEKLHQWLPLWQQATQMVPGSLRSHQGQKIEVEAVGIHRCQPPLILLRLFRQPRFLRQFIVQRQQFQRLQEQMARQTALIVELQQRQKQLEAENRHLQGVSQQDSLTKLANRRAFEACLRTAWRESATTHTPFAIALLDIDHFKRYNDTYGHLAGDRALQRVAHAIKSQVREADLVARYGGEEFILLLRHTHHDVAICVLERIFNYIRSLGIPHASSPVQPYLTVSAGICIVSATLRDCPMAELVATADAALYEAKRSGRDRYVLQTYAWMSAPVSSSQEIQSYP
ncbi:diguanylate cyclase [Thermosynechococcus sp. GLH187]|uniref:sensor domain-containing diguanylate cyclase n=1 Tax=unclassified Thermosynechococcus TaxID=2622553 RepID=UPI0028671C7E|nr:MULTISPECIES: diguanylate cyclase [unclassified Thermosynechococcus]MDR7921618.1 diguanylate cyclase [Thermosynechococcus sp. HY213]WNC46096.1 diguanylate cyclase [Thermosynechococcus sp. GLH187]WNC48633.1 diguanylate cyclase [Thermosynechococcus sp. GLH333]WNC51166.1 diguanylate cyclase [Thermosynechococcus sp. GLH87]